MSTPVIGANYTPYDTDDLRALFQPDGGRFKVSMLKHHGVVVRDEHKPAWVQEG